MPHPKAFVPPGTLPYRDIAATYHNTAIKQSSTLDVLRTMQDQQGQLNPKHVGRELISQNDTLVASSGQSRDKLKNWFTLFSFDEQSMTANRKYFMCLDERTLVTPTEPQKPLFLPRKTLVFNSQLVVTDLAMPEFNGLRFIKELRASGLRMPVIAISGWAKDQLDLAESYGADLALSKPIDGAELLRSVQEMLDLPDLPYREDPWRRGRGR